jgi:hypothetical protein
MVVGKECPRCGLLNLDSALACDCGEPFDPIGGEESATAEPERRSSSSPEHRGPHRGHHASLGSLVLVVLLLAGAVGLGAVFGKRSDGSPTPEPIRAPTKSADNSQSGLLEVRQLCLVKPYMFAFHAVFEVHTKGRESTGRELYFVRCERPNPKYQLVREPDKWNCDGSYLVDLDDLEKERQLNLFTIQVMTPEVESWEIDVVDKYGGSSAKGVADLRWGLQPNGSPLKTWSISLTPTTRGEATIEYRATNNGEPWRWATKTVVCSTGAD